MVKEGELILILLYKYPHYQHETFQIEETKIMSEEEKRPEENLEDNLDNADLPSLHKKYLTKVIVFSILCIVFFGWGVYSIVTYATHPDYEGVTMAWGIIYTLSMIISPIIAIAFFGKTLKNRRLLREVIHKQKGTESKDRTKYYTQPDLDTIALFEERGKHSIYFYYITTIMAIGFMIFYIVAYLDVDWIPRLGNLFGEVQVPILTDILTILGFVSSIPILVFFFAFLIDLPPLFKKKQDKKNKQEPLKFLKSLGANPKDIFSENTEKNAEEEKEVEKVDISEYAEMMGEEIEEEHPVKIHINSNNLGWGYNLIWLSCFVMGIPLKIFLPLYFLNLTIEVSIIVQIFNFVFWGIFLVIWLLYLIDKVPVWKAIKKLELKNDQKKYWKSE